MVPPVVDAQPAVPGEVDCEQREVEHHPAEDTADQRGITELRVIGQVRVSARGVGQRGERYAGRHAARDQHAVGEHPAESGVVGAAFAGGDGHPEAHQPDAAGDDVDCHQGVEQGVARHHLRFATYSPRTFGSGQE